MGVFKCKMCGGSLNVDGTKSVVACEYCDTVQTLPRLDDERRANLYDRANHFRRNNDFDKAMAIYEQILAEEPNDAEAYWSVVLCRYGVEYVDDPATHKRVPTVNRAQFTSIFDDENYKSAVANADSYQKKIYEAEANAINEIQKGILAISQREEPFDVFICYKETDANGRRTRDSVLATELYHELTKEGFKVFFSRITLEDKLGIAYEPYIFAALNSAKAMVVLGTRAEHFNAVWVKNEWSRYLSLMKNGAKKNLIPAYRDMDPYDLPDEFSHLQAQDMSKLGFMRDVVHGIKKLTEFERPQPASGVAVSEMKQENTQNIDSLLKRMFLFLEEGDWKNANTYCEKVLDTDPENAQAYLGKLMLDIRVRKQESLAMCAKSFERNYHYQKAIRFGGDSLKKQLQVYCEENERLINDKKVKARSTLFFFVKAGVRVFVVGILFALVLWLGICEQLMPLFDYPLLALAMACSVDAIICGYLRRRKGKAVDKRTKLVSYISLQLVLILYTVCIVVYWATYGVLLSLIGWILFAVLSCLFPILYFKLLPHLTTKTKDRCAFVVVITVLALAVCLLIISFVFPLRYRLLDDGTYGVVGTMHDMQKSIEIPNTHFGKDVTAVGREAFSWHYNLESITIPDTITDIDDLAFAGCCNLTKIAIPSGVTSINYGTFSGCKSLQIVEIPSSVTRISESAFSACWSLTEITIPSSVTNIDKNAFRWCTSLKTATFENTSGWYCTFTIYSKNYVSIPESSLADASVAAECLRSTYDWYYWSCRE